MVVLMATGGRHAAQCETARDRRIVNSLAYARPAPRVLAEAGARRALPGRLSGLSYALDLTEGQPRPLRPRCWIGSHVGRELGLNPPSAGPLLNHGQGLGSEQCARICEVYEDDDRALKQGTRRSAPARRDVAFVVAKTAHSRRSVGGWRR